MCVCTICVREPYIRHKYYGIQIEELSLPSGLVDTALTSLGSCEWHNS